MVESVKTEQFLSNYFITVVVHLLQVEFCLRKLDFSHDYTFKTVHWKQITRQACAHLVNILNLNGITWLSNSELTSGLARMVNLEQLFLLDTNLSNLDLKMVVKTTSKVCNIIFKYVQ